jgi:hypothetical protein
LIPSVIFELTEIVREGTTIMDPVLVAALTIGSCFLVSILALLSASGE